MLRRGVPDGERALRAGGESWLAPANTRVGLGWLLENLNLCTRFVELVVQFFPFFRNESDPALARTGHAFNPRRV